MSYAYDYINAQKWWSGLSNEQKQKFVDETVIFYRERNFEKLYDNEIKFLWRKFSGEF